MQKIVLDIKTIYIFAKTILFRSLVPLLIAQINLLKQPNQNNI